MSKLYVPYRGKKPSPMYINGHRVLVLSRDQESAKQALEFSGAEKIKRISSGETKEQESWTTSNLALKGKCDVIVTASDVGMPDLVKSLEKQLPWIH